MRQDIEASVIGGLLIGGLTPTASDVLAHLSRKRFQFRSTGKPSRLSASRRETET